VRFAPLHPRRQSDDQLTVPGSNGATGALVVRAAVPFDLVEKRQAAGMRGNQEQTSCCSSLLRAR